MNVAFQPVSHSNQNGFAGVKPYFAMPKMQPYTSDRVDFSSSASRVNFGSNIQTQTFKKLEPEEINDFIKQAILLSKNKFSGLEIFKDFSKEGKRTLLNQVKKDKAIPDFLLMATGNKPSALILGHVNSKLLPILEKSGYDVLNCKVLSSEGNTIKHSVISNRKVLQETIAQNKEFYTRRLKMNDGSSVEDLYKSLMGAQSPMSLINKNEHDILGITLGFPRNNTILWSLRRNAGLDSTAWTQLPERERISILRGRFESENSLYKDFSDEFKNNTLRHINSVDESRTIGCYIAQNGKCNLYSSIVFDSEPDEFARIVESIRSCTQAMKEINTGH